MTKVSVLMPIYKTNENHLREAIESILNQTFTDFEFLILDDCPDDDREAIVKSYKDKRIKYSKNEKNLGITPSRNKLMDMAKGEYLAIFDHDDISLPTRFEKQVKYLDENPEDGVVSCWAENFPNGKVCKNPIKNHDIKVALTDACIVLHPASMIRKSVLIENKIRYDVEYTPAEDYELWARLIRVTNFYNIPEVLFNYRIHETNTSKTQKNKMYNADVRIKAFIRLNYPELYYEYKVRLKKITKFRLFGIIPFLKIVELNNEKKVYLFSRILLFKQKTANLLEGK